MVLTLTQDKMIDAAAERTAVDRALSGDGRAYAQLVRPHLGMLYRVALRATGSAAVAEDAVQEALSVIHRELHRYRPGTSFKSFAASIAAKRAHSLLRAEARRRRRELASASDDADTRTPADWVEAHRTAERIRDALRGMPEKRQRAALLRLDAGLDYGEIAEALETTQASARVLVHLAMKELKENLRDVLAASETMATREENSRP